VQHKGIDIRGELGEPVYAVNSGKVVYAGSGLVGYGNLLIIKHSDRYLSAYAHNSRLLVGEGKIVKAGDRIAEIGDSGTDSVKLHFEIRCDGEPIDPLRILPQHQ
jgi:lipoprotein NlpD